MMIHRVHCSVCNQTNSLKDSMKFLIRSAADGYEIWEGGIECQTCATWTHGFWSTNFLIWQLQEIQALREIHLSPKEDQKNAERIEKLLKDYTEEFEAFQIAQEERNFDANIRH